MQNEPSPARGRRRSARWALALVAVSLVAALGAGAAAPAASTRASSFCPTGHVHFAKTKFVFHAGLAFGAFHRYIWKPFRAGEFRSGAPHRLSAAVKAGASALFVYHELSLACQDANSSSVLRPIVHPLSTLTGGFDALAAKLKGGSFSDSDLSSIGKQVDQLGQASASAGVPISG